MSTEILYYKYNWYLALDLLVLLVCKFGDLLILKTDFDFIEL